MPFDDRGFSAASRPAPWLRCPRAIGSGVRALLAPAAEPAELAVIRVLEEARGLIEETQDWGQGRYETLAGRRCAVGALRVASDLLDYGKAGEQAQEILAEIARAGGFHDVENMNDHCSHDAVLAAFDAALAAARLRAWKARTRA